MLRIQAARHELRCFECRVTWRSWLQRLLGINAGYHPRRPAVTDNPSDEQVIQSLIGGKEDPDVEALLERLKGGVGKELIWMPEDAYERGRADERQRNVAMTRERAGIRLGRIDKPSEYVREGMHRAADLIESETSHE